MPPVLHVVPAVAAEPLSPSEAQALLESARLLHLARQDGAAICLLRGKNLGLICEDEESFEAALFQRAATCLGARVSHIRPLPADSDPKVVRDTARVLGRLYDAVECQGLPGTLVESIRADAGVPVYDAMSLLREPAVRLVRDVLGDSEADIAVTTLQALLLSTLA
jgi:ornithine carbamoyltransferase